jgi:DNA-binding LacI/PurR family transcriptional regulator
MLVADAMRSAKNGKIATDSGAAILVDPNVDAIVQDRVAALRKALEAAGVKRVDEVKFDRTFEDGKDKLVAHLKAHPETTLVFGVSAAGVIAADEATGVLKDDHPFAIAGYTGEDSARNQIMMNEYSAVAILSIDRLLRRAVNVAGGLLNGDKVPDKDVLMVPVLEAGPEAGLPRMKIDPPEKPHMPGGAETPVEKK